MTVQAFLGRCWPAAAAVLLLSCGGSVGPSPNVTDPNTITIQPGGTASAPVLTYGGLATTFVITGGTGSYLVTSNNQTVVPNPSGAVGHSLTIVPNPVASDQTVILTVRDTGTTVPVSITLTVRPGTVSNEITFTPTVTTCAPAFCSGGDGLLVATLSQGGLALPARGARVDILSGDIRIITTPPGTAPEQLALTLITTSDETGRLRIRLRALPVAPNQTALIEITDLGTNAFQRFAISIAQFTGNTPPFFTLPAAITFTGPFLGQCAQNAASDVAVFGGTPPYNIVNTAAPIFVQPSVVAASGQTFQVRLVSSACFTDVPVAITDASGRTIFITVTNQEGTASVPDPPVALSPASVTLSCGTSASFIINGGSGTSFAAGSNHPRVTVVVTGRTVTVTRAASDALFPPTPPAAGYATSATITVTDGTTVAAATALVPALCP